MSEKQELYAMAEQRLDSADMSMAKGHNDSAMPDALLGIGYAILALVAKLDELTDTEADGSNPILRVYDPTGGA